MNSEQFARILVISIVAGVIAALGLGWLLRPPSPLAGPPLLHARLAENGGWAPDSLVAVAGQPLHLRMTSDDVTHSFAVGHSFAIGQSDLPPVDVTPGEISEVTLTFDRPGKYTYYCTRWCGANHWRMRGVIEVSDPEEGDPAAREMEKGKPPLYVTLGLDIDAGHPVEAPLPRKKPSANQGAALDVPIPAEITARTYYLAHSPAEAFQKLKAEPGLGELSDQDLWNLVAALWKTNIPSQNLESGRRLYATNCAACHGERGGGDGVFAAELAQSLSDTHSGMAKGEMTQQPADFTDAGQMLAASPALLQGKIIRGGMGTGMPYWGPIFTEEQTWDLVAFLWSFQFDLEEKE